LNAVLHSANQIRVRTRYNFTPRHDVGSTLAATAIASVARAAVRGENRASADIFLRVDWFERKQVNE
jgi:hypothetical protein